jgi:hypothetical protein
MAKSFSEWKNEREQQQEGTFLPRITSAVKSGLNRLGTMMGRRGGIGAKARDSLELMKQNFLEPEMAKMDLGQKRNFLNRLRLEIQKYISELPPDDQAPPPV